MTLLQDLIQFQCKENLQNRLELATIPYKTFYKDLVAEGGEEIMKLLTTLLRIRTSKITYNALHLDEDITNKLSEEEEEYYNTIKSAGVKLSHLNKPLMIV